MSTLSAQLMAEFGRGYSAKTLRHMMQFSEVFLEVQIVSSLTRQLTWTHCLEIIYIKDRLKREFYAEMCHLEKWSVRALRQKIDGMLFERTVLSGKAEAVIDAEIASLREEERAAYGKRIVVILSQQLEREFGRGL